MEEESSTRCLLVVRLVPELGYICVAVSSVVSDASYIRSWCLLAGLHREASPWQYLTSICSTGMVPASSTRSGNETRKPSCPLMRYMLLPYLLMKYALLAFDVSLSGSMLVLFTARVELNHTWGDGTLGTLISVQNNLSLLCQFFFRPLALWWAILD